MLFTNSPSDIYMQAHTLFAGGCSESERKMDHRNATRGVESSLTVGLGRSKHVHHAKLTRAGSTRTPSARREEVLDGFIFMERSKIVRHAVSSATCMLRRNNGHKLGT